MMHKWLALWVCVFVWTSCHNGSSLKKAHSDGKQEVVEDVLGGAGEGSNANPKEGYFEGDNLMKADRPIRFGDSIVLSSKGHQTILVENDSLKIRVVAIGNRALGYGRTKRRTVNSEHITVSSNTYKVDIYSPDRREVTASVDVLTLIRENIDPNVKALRHWVFDPFKDNLVERISDARQVETYYYTGGVTTNDTLYCLNVHSEVSDGLVSQGVKSYVIVFDTGGKAVASFDLGRQTVRSVLSASGDYLAVVSMEKYDSAEQLSVFDVQKGRLIKDDLIVEGYSFYGVVPGIPTGFKNQDNFRAFYKNKSSYAISLIDPKERVVNTCTMPKDEWTKKLEAHFFFQDDIKIKEKLEHWETIKF